MAKVFISSTGRDLEEYRRAAIAVCNRLSLVPIAMEHFEATGRGIVESSKKKLDLADVYVGLFAHRYGSIEKGHTRSVTEIEFDYAAERGLDRLCFLVDPSYPWPPELIDFEQLDKLRSFRERVSRSLVRAIFTTVDSFRFALLQALVSWRDAHEASSAGHKPMKELEPAIVKTPPQPGLVVGREAETEELKARLGLRQRERRRKVNVVRGWPGVGKTTLVKYLAYDPEIAAAFPDGVLWASLGFQGSPLPELNVWGEEVGAFDRSHPTTLREALKLLRPVFRRRRMLLIVDDVWRADDAIPFKHVAGPDCALLVTTRFPEVARLVADSPGDDIYVLEVLGDHQGLTLLRRLAPKVVEALPVATLQLVRDLEGLPLAIRIAGRLLEAEAALGLPVSPLISELRESHRLLDERAPDDRFDPETGTTPTLNLLLQRSTDSLDATTRDRFAALGVFAPKPATFDANAIRFIWETDPMPTVRTLVDRGLLEPMVSQGRFQMHAVLVLHAQRLLDL